MVENKINSVYARPFQLGTCWLSERSASLLVISCKVDFRRPYDRVWNQAGVSFQTLLVSEINSEKKIFGRLCLVNAVYDNLPLKDAKSYLGGLRKQYRI